MRDLVAFLAARLVVDGAAAARAQALREKLDDPHRQISQGVRDGAEYAWREAEVDPARMLREVEAKRAILDAYIRADGDSHRDRDRGRWDSLHAAVRALVAIYGDHPDFDPAWAAAAAQAPT